MDNIAIIGSSGAIGCAFTQQLSVLYPEATIHTVSRAQVQLSRKNIIHHLIDYDDEASIEQVASVASTHAPLDAVIVATGILHHDNIMPEKSLRDLSMEKFQIIFAANTILPLLIAKHFLPALRKDNRSVFAALSARVGSISDNQLGGWYAYRASKAALNMLIKTASIELRRSNENAIVVGLHPGTVDSRLSEPFQANVPDGALFTPEFSVNKMLDVIKHLLPEHSGKCFAWDGEEIEP